ncbi:hypothetical protein D6858_02885 [Tsuneonella suprasediminis]|uniref:Uncharacterized protein n=1 Tax=Tsuneonella suprasediminis TaxID=2306996 RepID=A0A419R4I2_9SPHN|nr:hypothetical protein D6858_02885 [Tsuneonella suprasediminis]
MCAQYLLMLITDHLLSQLSFDQLRQRDCAGFFGWPEDIGFSRIYSRIQTRGAAGLRSADPVSGRSM